MTSKVYEKVLYFIALKAMKTPVDIWMGERHPLISRTIIKHHLTSGSLCSPVSGDHLARSFVNFKSAVNWTIRMTLCHLLTQLQPPSNRVIPAMAAVGRTCVSRLFENTTLTRFMCSRLVHLFSSNCRFFLVLRLGRFFFVKEGL